MSKPILSELEYNADDVASAILSKADLSVTNEDLGVNDRSSLFEAESGFTSGFFKVAYSFNGFMFLSLFAQNTSVPSNGTKMVQMSDSDFYPSTNTRFPSVSYQADSSQYVEARNDGGLYLSWPTSAGGDDTNFYITINGFFRYS